MKRNVLIAVAALFMLSLSALAAAETKKEEGNWQFNLAPFYLWAVSLDGDVVMNNQASTVSADFGDLFSNLESVFIVHFETLYKEKYGFMFDVNYINIEGSAPAPISTVNLDLDTTIAEAALYQCWKKDVHAVDLMAGVLYSKIDQEATFTRLPIRISVSEDWVDPIIILRWHWAFAEKWGLTLKGGVGGFGVSSDFIWEGIGLVTFQPWKYAEIMAGYRAVGIDYETGAGNTRFVYDVTMAGPLVGINFKW